MYPRYKDNRYDETSIDNPFWVFADTLYYLVDNENVEEERKRLIEVKAKRKTRSA